MKKLNKGFTMVEILVVVGLIAILGVIAVVSFGNIQDGVRRSSVQADARSLSTMINTANALNPGAVGDQASLTIPAAANTAASPHNITAPGVPVQTMVIPAGQRAVTVGSVVQIVGGHASVNETTLTGLGSAAFVTTAGQVFITVGP